MILRMFRDVGGAGLQDRGIEVSRNGNENDLKGRDGDGWNGMGGNLT